MHLRSRSGVRSSSYPWLEELANASKVDSFFSLLILMHESMMDG